MHRHLFLSKSKLHLVLIYNELKTKDLYGRKLRLKPPVEILYISKEHVNVEWRYAFTMYILHHSC